MEDVEAPTMLVEREGLTGVVKMFDHNRLFGFITLSKEDGGGDVFLHQKEVAGKRKLNPGDRVELDTKFRGPGALRAVDVTPLGERQRRQLSLMAREAMEHKRTDLSLAGSFAASSSGGGGGGGMASDPQERAALPAGLMSAADLRKRRREEDEAAARVAAADADGAGPAPLGGGAPRMSSSKEKKEMKKKKRKAAGGGLSFSIDDDGGGDGD